MKRKIILFTALLATTISLASCGKKTYTVVFDSDGGSEIPSQNVEEGKLVTRPADPIKTDYTFDGWLLDNKLYDFATPVTKDFTLTASYKMPVDPDFPEDENSKLPENIHDYDNLTSYTFKIVHHPSKENNPFESLDFTFDEPFTDMINNDPTVYNKKLFQFAEMTNIEMNRDGVSLFKNPKTGEYESDKTLMSTFKYVGFSDIRYFDEEKQTYEVDTHDRTSLGLANKEISLNGQKYQIFVYNFRGTLNNDEWASNFDVGIDNETYTQDRASEHPEWKNAKNHKGFDVAATRLLGVIDKYANRFKESDVTPICLFMGHSRGAAVGNIVAKAYTDRNIKTFAYFSAGPNVDNDVIGSQGYNNIFNHSNIHDIVPALYPDECSFSRFGITKTFDLHDYKEDFEKTFVGLNYVDSDLSCYLGIIKEYFVSRENLFTLSDFSIECDSEDDADNIILDYNKYFNNNPVKRRLIVEQNPVYDQDNDCYLVKFKTCNALALDLMIDIFNNMKSEDASVLDVVGNYLPYLVNAKTLIVENIFDILANLNIDAFKIGHSIASYLYAAFKL